MSAWRVIFTDSESLSGVAPACPQTATKHPTFRIDLDLEVDPSPDPHGVYDCCPGPHIECYGEQHAKAVADALTTAGPEICP